jgi:hypothetical protein
LTARSQKIQEYIRNPAAKRKGVVRIELEGNRHELDVYQIPWEFLIFNVKNGRLAKEVLHYEHLNNQKLDPENKDDALVIRKMLLRQDTAATDYLKDDIRRVGQLEAGIITHDGIVINANRRFAVLQELYDEDKLEKHRFMEVAVLPPHVSPRDLWMIEAGLQLSRDPRLSYGPINGRLKLREGKDSNLSSAELALAMGRGMKASDVDEQLEELDLIDQYLDFIEAPLDYQKAEDKMNHFIDLCAILKRADDEGLTDQEKFDLQLVCFNFIKMNVVTHRELREVRKILQSPEARKILTKSLESPVAGVPPIPSGTVIPSGPSPGPSPAVSPPPSAGGTLSPPFPNAVAEPLKSELKDSFERARDVANAKELRERPSKLAQKAYDNLEAIPLDSPHLGEAQVVRILTDIQRKVEQLLKRG